MTIRLLVWDQRFFNQLTDGRDIIVESCEFRFDSRYTDEHQIVVRGDRYTNLKLCG